MKKTFTLCQIAVDLPFQDEQLTAHDLPLSNDGEHDPVELRSFSSLGDALAALEATRSTITLRRDWDHSPKAWEGSVHFVSEQIEDGGELRSGPDHTGPLSIEPWEPSLQDIDPIHILQHSGCTSQEAEQHLQAGSTVYSPEDFVLFLREEQDEEEQMDSLNAAGCQTFEELLALCRAGQLRGDCLANGLFPSGSSAIPYVVTFVL